MTFPADTFEEAVNLSITASNQLHIILNGDSTTEVTVEDGSKIPSVRKAYTDSLFFLSPQSWAVGDYETVYNQLRAFVEPTGITTWWFSKTATVSTPILMSTTPHDDSNWTLWNAINNSVYETQKRLAAEAGLNMVGSFLLGGTVTNVGDVVFYESDGKYYSWSGAFPKVVAAGSTPATSGGIGAGAWVDRTDLTFRSDLASESGSGLVGYQPAGTGAVATTVHSKLREGVSVFDFMTEAQIADVKAETTLMDVTAAIQAALDSGATDIYLPDGFYGIKATGAALKLSASGVKFYGTGTLVPLANAFGWAPQQMLIVSGDRNMININLANSSDLGKRTSDASNEYPMDGIRVTGSENTVRDCGVWNFVTPIVIRGGTGNKVLFNRLTSKQVSNLAWPNDGILWFQTNQGVCLGNEVGLATSASQRVVTMESVPSAGLSTLRTGITLDGYTSAVLVEGNHVGEGFVVGIHSEGSGVRRHTISNNVIYKQRRNAINAAGQRLVIVGNRCLGSFNTDTTATLTGIIGSVDGKAVILGNTIECDVSDVDGIHTLANAADVMIQGNLFDGTFKYCVEGVANNVQVIGNTLRGTAFRFASLDKPSAVVGDVSAIVDSNYANVITNQFAVFGSGLLGSVSKNKICMGEGYAAADGVIKFGGGYSSAVTSAKIQIIGNDCSYVGTTAVTGTKAFVESTASSGTKLRGIIKDNSFDTTIWSSIATGTWLSGSNFFVSGNSNDTSSYIGARTGSFTLSAASTTSVANNSVSASSTVLLFPLNAGAATLMQGTKSLYVSGRVAGTRFDVSTADATAAAGTEQFMYAIIG